MGPSMRKDEFCHEKERNKLLQEDMEAALQDIQNIWIGLKKDHFSIDQTFANMTGYEKNENLYLT